MNYTIHAVRLDYGLGEKTGIIHTLEAETPEEALEQFHKDIHLTELEVIMDIKIEVVEEK